MFESVHETCSQTNSITLHVTPTPVKLWQGQQPLNQSDKAIDLILNCDAMQILLFNQSKKISNDQELIQSDLTSCPINQKGNN